MSSSTTSPGYISATELYRLAEAKRRLEHGASLLRAPATGRIADAEGWPLRLHQGRRILAAIKAAAEQQAGDNQESEVLQ